MPTISKDERGRVIVEYSGYRDIENYLSEKTENTNARNESGWSKSFCPHTWNEARDMLTSGFPEGSQEIDDIKTGMVDQISDVMNETRYDVTGDFIDIGRYCDGEPEHFGYMDLKQGPTKKLDVTVNISSRGDILASEILTRGAAISATIDQLMDDYFINLKVVQETSEVDWQVVARDFRVIVNVDTGNGYSRDLLNYYLACASFKRRLIFNTYEKVLGRQSCSPYGRSEDIEPKPKGLYFPLIKSGEWTKNNAVSKIKAILAEYKTSQE